MTLMPLRCAENVRVKQAVDNAGGSFVNLPAMLRVPMLTKPLVDIENDAKASAATYRPVPTFGAVQYDWCRSHRPRSSLLNHSNL